MTSKKRQRTLRDSLFRAGQPQLELEVAHVVPASASTSISDEASSKVDAVQAARMLWKDKWIHDFYWLEFQSEIGRAFCNVCKAAGGRGVFATTGSVNIKYSAFHDNSQSVEHRKLAWAAQSGSKRMEKHIAEQSKTADEALLTLFKTAYYIGMGTIPFSKFTPLCDLLVDLKTDITPTLYHDDKACADMLICISSVIHRKMLDRIRNSLYYGIMIDESTDISVTGHLVVFATFLEDGVPACVFLGLLHIPDGKKDAGVIFDILLTSLKQWGLDLEKFVGFGSDGAAVMLGCRNGVATKLKKEVNPFLLSIHCVAHRTNLASLDAAGSRSCKDMSKVLDKMLNDTAAIFKKSSKAKCELATLKKELFDTSKTLKRYQKIRWLSRWQAVTTLCDSLESVIAYFRDVPRTDDDAATGLFYTKLRTFKYIYCLYFLADILHSLSVLSRTFQYKFVDVSSVGALVKSEITAIRMTFIIESTDLNESTFNEDTGYHIIPSFGPPGGYLQRLSSEIRGSKFHDVEMIRDRTRADLVEALAFQTSFAEEVCKGLEARFQDNDVVSCFKILNPCELPSRQVGMKSWGVAELKKLCDHFGKAKMIGENTYAPMINADAVRREFHAYKIQASTEWREKTFPDLWSMISWNHALQLKYANLRVLADIARVQCVSTAQCERAFSIQNCIKTKFCNKLQTKNLESVVRVAIEGMRADRESILVEAISLWKNSRKFRWLFSHPEKYLSGHVDLEGECDDFDLDLDV